MVLHNGLVVPLFLACAFSQGQPEEVVRVLENALALRAKACRVARIAMTDWDGKVARECEVDDFKIESLSWPGTQFSVSAKEISFDFRRADQGMERFSVRADFPSSLRHGSISQAVERALEMMRELVPMKVVAHLSREEGTSYRIRCYPIANGYQVNSQNHDFWVDKGSGWIKRAFLPSGPMPKLPDSLTRGASVHQTQARAILAVSKTFGAGALKITAEGTAIGLYQDALARPYRVTFFNDQDRAKIERNEAFLLDSFAFTDETNSEGHYTVSVDAVSGRVMRVNDSYKSLGYLDTQYPPPTPPEPETMPVQRIGNLHPVLPVSDSLERISDPGAFTSDGLIAVMSESRCAAIEVDLDRYVGRVVTRLGARFYRLSVKVVVAMKKLLSQTVMYKV